MDDPAQGGEAAGSVVAPRLAALARIAARVASATSMDDLTEIITEQASEVMGASRSVLALREGSTQLRTIATHGLSPAEARQWATLPLDEPSPLTDAVRTGRVVVIADRADILERYPDLDDGTERSSVALPLISRTDESTIGSVGFRFDGRSGRPTSTSCRSSRC